MWAIRDRATFARLSTTGQKARRGPVWVRWVVDTEVTPPRVAFSVGVPVGPAVIRNQIRRRCRSSIADHGLPSGAYLFGVAPAAADLTFDQLYCLVGLLCEHIVRGANVPSK